MRGYFGIGDNTPDRLMANARVVDMCDRVDVQVSDMRRMPFDAALSVAAIDHLTAEGIAEALAEAARVLRSRGELLIVPINVDGRVRTQPNVETVVGQTNAPTR